MAEKLRSGYTTGTHATAVLVACLHEYFEEKIFTHLEVQLPQQKLAPIEVIHKEKYYFSTIKGENDDMDVTKGAEISCKLQTHKPQKLKAQTASLLEFETLKISLWAGDGVGVVTKKGLKIAPNYPAINPIPLEMMRENSLEILKQKSGELHAIFSVVDGEAIAKETANEKVGVLGGISILGTRGIVKPVSSEAYIDSIATEIAVAAAFDASVIVFTLGNSALDFAKEQYDETNIVEIGNFVYDSLEQLQKHHFKKMIFITSVAKMCKVAQGSKNTHNRFGGIDFKEVKKWLKEEQGITLQEEFVTLKGVLEAVEEKEPFVKLVSKKALKQLLNWSETLSLKCESMEVVTLPYKIKIKEFTNV